MHPLIQIHDLTKLTETELLTLEARLRDLILTGVMSDADRERCAVSLSNTVFVQTARRLIPRLG